MDPNEHTADLAHIRSLMERSTRFLSLSGLSGVFAGVVALAGARLAQVHLACFGTASTDALTYGVRPSTAFTPDGPAMVLLGDAVVVLAVALLGAFWFTWRRTRRLGHRLWDASARRLVVNMLVPLAAGGVCCLALFYQGLPGLVAPATLVFYGLALFNAGNYTLDEIRGLGLSELALGLVSLFLPGAGLLLWALGFGVLHIVYGGLMWYRHESGPGRNRQ